MLSGYGYDMYTDTEIWLNWKNIGHKTWPLYTY